MTVRSLAALVLFSLAVVEVRLVMAADPPDAPTEGARQPQIVRGFGDPPCSLPSGVAGAPYDVVAGQFIPGAVTKPLSDVEPDAEKGAIVFAARSLGDCLACHTVSALTKRANAREGGNGARWASAATVGPALDGVADRYTSGELRFILLDPATALSNPDTVKYSYTATNNLNDVKGACQNQPILTAGEIEHLIAFLRTLKK